jgi:hypothetical protein
MVKREEIAIPLLKQCPEKAKIKLEVEGCHEGKNNRLDSHDAFACAKQFSLLTFRAF